MIIKTLHKAGVLLLMTHMLTGCHKDDFGSGDNTSINRWVYNSFATDYLWRSEIRKADSQPSDIDPFDYFNSVIKSPEDRYSFCFSQASSRSGATQYISKSSDEGFGFQARVFENPTTFNIVSGQIITVIHGSSAHKAGLRRGDMFNAINSIAMPISFAQYQSEMGQSSITLQVNSKSEPVRLTRSRYVNDPVLFDSVIRINNTNVGYLVYNHFSSGDGLLTRKLHDAFARMKSQNISELILDLRYNPGGEIDECRRLASLIVPRSALFDTFLYMENAYCYGDPRHFERLSFIQPHLIERYNVGVGRLYILTTERTASASEIIMHALKPLYGDNMKIIGRRSAGKNVGGVRLTSPNGLWDINKITIRIYDKNRVSGYESGIEADFKASEAPLVGKFGDIENDNLLRTLLKEVYGQSLKPKAQLTVNEEHMSLKARYLIPEGEMFIDCLKK